MSHVIARYITLLGQVSFWTVFFFFCILGMCLRDEEVLVLLKTRTTAFLYTESILQSWESESSTQLYMIGHICKKYYKYVQHLVFHCLNTFIECTAYELYKSWTFLKIPFLKTPYITTEFILYLGSQYHSKISKTANHVIIFDEGFRCTEVNLSPII